MKMVYIPSSISERLVVFLTPNNFSTAPKRLQVPPRAASVVDGGDSLV